MYFVGHNIQVCIHFMIERLKIRRILNSELVDNLINPSDINLFDSTINCKKQPKQVQLECAFSQVIGQFFKNG